MVLLDTCASHSSAYMHDLTLMDPQKTPLFLACSNGHQVAAEVLMKEKADVTAQSYNKLNCLDIAVKNGHKYVVHCI